MFLLHCFAELEEVLWNELIVSCLFVTVISVVRQWQNFAEGHDQKEGLADRFVIASAGTSREEIGNPVHQGTRKKLAQDHISAAGKYAVQLTKEDYEKYDLILGMDRANISNILRIIGSDPQEKVHRLLDFTELPRDIADPWYTGDFEITYAEIKAGCAALLKHLRRF